MVSRVFATLILAYIFPPEEEVSEITPAITIAPCGREDIEILHNIEIDSDHKIIENKLAKHWNSIERVDYMQMMQVRFP